MDIGVLTAHRSTRRLAITYFLSKCGEFAFEAAFFVAIVNLTDAELLLIGFVYFCRYMPCLLFSQVGGWLADNVEKKIHIGHGRAIALCGSCCVVRELFAG